MVRVSQQRAAMGEDFIQLSGEDVTTSVTWRRRSWLHFGHVQRRAAAVLRTDVSAVWQKGDHATALKLQDKLMPLHD